MKKFYLSVDIEGIWGNGNPQYTSRHTDEYEQYRKNMIDETNLAIECLFDQGIEEIIVNDGHGGMDNLISYELDPRVSFISAKGSYKELGMMEGLDPSFDGCGYVGYHTKAGTQSGNMAHTISGAVVDKVLIKGNPVSEAQMNTLLASYYDVPLMFIAGDDALHRQIQEDMGDIPFVETKKSINFMTTLNCSKNELKQRYQKVISSMMNYPGYIEEPVNTLDIVFLNERNADFVSRIPTVERINNKTVRLTASNYEELYKLARFVIKVSNAF